MNEALAKPAYRPIKERCQVAATNLMEQAADTSERFQQQVLGFKQELNSDEKIVRILNR